MHEDGWRFKRGGDGGTGVAQEQLVTPVGASRVPSGQAHSGRRRPCAGRAARAHLVRRVFAALVVSSVAGAGALPAIAAPGCRLSSASAPPPAPAATRSEAEAPAPEARCCSARGGGRAAGEGGRRGER